MAWMISNVVNMRPNNKFPSPGKQKPENKIDGPIALITAMARAMFAPDKSSVYDRRGVITL